METINNYIIINYDTNDDNDDNDEIDIFNKITIIIGLLFSYFGMNYYKLGPGNFMRNTNFETYIMILTILIIIITLFFIFNCLLSYYFCNFSIYFI